MKFCKKMIVVLALLLLPSTVLAKYVAVLETMADPAAKQIVSQSDRTYLTDVLRGEAVKVLPAEQNFTIMTRENINVMLPPGKSIEDCEGSCLAETGKNIAADFVAQARVGMFGGSLTLNVEVYETAGNKLVASFNGDGEKVKDLLAVIKREAPDFFKKIKGRSSGYDIVGGVGAVSSGGSFSFQGSQKFVVEIVTNPAGALPTVDGKGFQKCTSTPCKVQLEAGEHRFVASMDNYDDVETIVLVNANNQQVVLNLTSNFGYLNVRPELLENVGKTDDFIVTIDGQKANYGKNDLNPGVHAVSVKHPCYDPAEFNVAIEKQKTEIFDAKLSRGIGGLVLDADLKGVPQAVPVYIDGKEVGSTPFEGEVPMCAEIAVGEARETVAVNLKWHEVVKATHHLNQGFASVGGEIPQVGESVPTNIDTSKSKIHWVPLAISGVALVSGTVLAIVGNSKAKSASEKEIANEGDYKKNRDDVRSGESIRAVGLIAAIAGAVGVGVSFAF